MARVSHRARFAFLIGVWALGVMPGLVFTQGQTQTGQQTTPPPPPTTVVDLRDLPARPPAIQRGITVTGSARVVEIIDFMPLAAGRNPKKLSEIAMKFPPDNKPTDEKIALGRRLFFDKSLSIDRSTSCATCHDPERGFADSNALAVGVGGKVGRRNSPTLVNRGFGSKQFWDGRAVSLEDLALQPISDPNEMAMPLPDLLKRLSEDSSYQSDFRAVFGREVVADDVRWALAAYLRTIRSGDSPYDRFIEGDADALSADAKAGLEVFRGKARCAGCHREPLFTTESFYNTGVAVSPDGNFADDGRFKETNQPRERGAFKIPTLREVARTAPYMHDGSLATLADVVEFYDKGGNKNPNLMPLIRPLFLGADEKRALIAFLESLSGVVQGK